MKSDLIYLNRDLEPSFAEQEYKKINQTLLSLLKFRQVNPKNYTRYECPENCIFDIKNGLPDMALNCPTGFLDEERKLDINKLTRFKLDLQENLKILAERNGINFNFQPKTNNIVLFGTKKIGSKVYKLFYVNRLIAQNNLEQSHILKLKSYYKQEETAFIITPAEFILDNNSELFLKEHSCEIISLKTLIDNDLIINRIGITNEADIKRIAGLYELAIFNSQEVYFQGIKLSIFPQCYDLLVYLAQNANIARARNDCIKSLWGFDAQYDWHDRNLSDTCSLLRKSFKEGNPTKPVDNNFIQAKGGCIMLNLSNDKVFLYQG